MSKEYESIMIIGGEAAEKIISGEVKCMIMHRVSADGFSENTFVRNTPVIQCISPSCQNGESKVKFSVKADFNGRLFPEISRLIFSEKLDLVYEIRCGSETVASGNINACGFEIVPSDNEENPELRFIEEYISGNEVTDEHIEINGINDELNALRGNYNVFFNMAVAMLLEAVTCAGAYLLFKFTSLGSLIIIIMLFIFLLILNIISYLLCSYKATENIDRLSV